MSDDLDLLERFEPLATATFAPTTGTDVLRARVGRRRRRHRAVLAGGTVAGLVLIGALAVAARGDAPEPIDDVRAAAPTTTIPTPAPIGTEPRLVVGVVPPAMASHGCALSDEAGEGAWVSCQLGIPGTPAPDGINLAWRRGPAAPDLRAAWDRRDGKFVAQATGGLHGEVAFVEIGGKTVLDLGETDRVDGSSLGLPDRVTRTYEVMVGESMVQVNAEGATGEQLDQVIGGLSLDPAGLGFTIPQGDLPAGATPIAQGPQRLWFEPEQSDPSRSLDNGGEVSGITFAVAGERTSLVVTVVRNVDAAGYLDRWAEQQQRTASTGPEPVDAEGRHGRMVGRRFAGAASGPIAARSYAVAADDRTVVLVEGPAEIEDSLLDIAGRTVVAEATDPAPTPSVTPTTTVAPGPTTASAGEETSDTVPAGDATGWYAPELLPAGWVTHSAHAFATDGSGEAQLSFTSPTGNLVVVTLSVPRDRPWHRDDAELHPLPGLSSPVWAEAADSSARGSLVAARPAAIIRATWVDIAAVGQEPGRLAEATGAAELEQVMTALIRVGSDRWRSYLANVPTVDDALLAADTLEALPDET